MMNKVIATFILVAGVSYLAFVFDSSEAVNRDFIAYWSAGQLLRHHENPYAFEETLRIERLAGFQGSEPLVQRMPPVSLPLLLPLGFIGARSGAVVWSLLIIGLLIFALYSVRQIHNFPPNRLHLLGYVFAPALACILSGQTGVILLSGLVLFQRFHRSRVFFAGLSLALWSLKPHLFLPYSVALAVWIIANRQYRLLVGALTGLAGLSLASVWLNPRAWEQYLAMIRAAGIQEEALPNVSLLFRIVIDREAAWLQCLPAVAAMVWALWYAQRHSSTWDWGTHGSLVLLVSLLVAPYSWFTDEIILIPAMLHAIYFAEARGRSLTCYVIPAGLATLLVLGGAPLYSMYYAWTPVAWLTCWLQLERSPAGSRLTRPQEVPV